MNSVGDSFAWGFRDPGWAGKMLLQGLIALIPIVGWIAMTGWLMMAFENVRAGKNELPPAGFHLERGIAIFGVFLIYESSCRSRAGCSGSPAGSHPGTAAQP